MNCITKCFPFIPDKEYLEECLKRNGIKDNLKLEKQKVLVAYTLNNGTYRFFKGFVLKYPKCKINRRHFRNDIF